MSDFALALILFSIFFFVLPELCSTCPVTYFQCDGENANGTRQCGSHSLRCSKDRPAKLEIQFDGKGPWYTIFLTYPEKKTTVYDNHLSRQLSGDCDFFYNFTSPISDFYPSSIVELNSTATMFNCSGNSYNFSNDVFEKYHRSGYCSRYDLYYSHNQPRVSSESEEDWNPVEWEMSFRENDGSVVDFSLVSVGFSNHRQGNLSSERFNCQMKSGVCSPFSNSSFNCSCDHGCGTAS